MNPITKLFFALARRLPGGAGSSRPRRQGRFLPRLETLEDRLAPATRVWDGNALSNNWSNPLNWDFNIAPAAGDDLVFPAGAFNDSKVADNDFPAGLNIRSITFQGGGFTVRGNRINLGVGGITDNSGSSNVISLDFNMGAGPITVSQGGNLFIEDVISGSSLIKAGPGNVSFSGQNTYTGNTLVSAGTLFARSDNALGTTGGVTTVSSGARLFIEDQVLGTMKVSETLNLPTGSELHVLGNVDLLGTLTFGAAGKLFTDGDVSVEGPVAFGTDSSIVAIHDLEFRGSIQLLGGFLNMEGNPGDQVIFIRDRITMQGPISGPGGLRVGFSLDIQTVIGEEEGLFLSGPAANTYQGGTFSLGTVFLEKPAGVTAIPGGEVHLLGGGVLRNSNQIGDTAHVFVVTDTFDLNGNDETIAALTLGANGKVDTAGVLRTGVLTVNGAVTGDGLFPPVPGVIVPTISGELSFGAATGTFDVDGETLVVSAKINAGGGIIKTGAGTLLLTANNNYPGTTTVNGGLLRVHGNQPQSKVVVNNGGQFAGNGTIGTLTVNAGGRVRPGPLSSPGILRVEGDLIFNPGAILEVQLNGDVAGIGHDQINVQGPGSSGPGSGIVHFNGALLEATVGLGNAVGDTFRIINNDDSDFPSQETFTVAGQGSIPQGGAFNALTPDRFSINYAGGVSSNDVVLTKLSARPLFPNRSVTPLIQEGQKVVLTGTISDRDPRDFFILEVNWGDGTPTETRRFPPRFNGTQIQLTHRYRDDPPGDSDIYTIELAWRDQHGEGNSGTLTTEVQNVDPILDERSLTRLRSGGALNRLISFTDPGADSWTATVDYGDGSGAQPLEVHGQRLRLQHHYQPGIYTVTVTVEDGDGGVATAELQVHIKGAGGLIDLPFIDRHKPRRR